MSEQKKAFQVSVDLVTHARMVKHSKNSYRTVRKQLEHDLKELYKGVSLSADELRFFGLGEEQLRNYPDLMAKINHSATAQTDEDDEELL